MIINAHNKIMGRIATIAAKSAMLGNEVYIVNCETAVISGDKARIFAEFQRKRSMGIPAKGPFIKRSPEMIMKRAIRGMLPYKQPKGRDAFKRIKCYRNIPDSMKDAKLINNEEADIKKLPITKHVTLAEVSKNMGGK
ncbi:MAG: 50S ribosomal protein L13 [Candidatus Woesearchaeota archaeon]